MAMTDPSHVLQYQLDALLATFDRLVAEHRIGVEEQIAHTLAAIRRVASQLELEEVRRRMIAGQNEWRR
jgi:hypothetical protein